MSYCRFSSDDFRCDAYVYESVDGYVAHVASTRIVFADPVPPVIPRLRRASNQEIRAWIKRQQAVLRIIERSERVPIGLPHDGATFVDGSPGECADRLEELKALGYNVPDYAIAALREEAAE